jgi:hypothetical protein
MAAFDINPQDNNLLGANYSATGTTSITFTVADLPPLNTLTSTELADATGDSRKIIYALLQGIYAKYKALTTDLPTKMTIARTTTVSDTTQTASVTFTIRFLTTDVTTTVADEA